MLYIIINVYKLYIYINILLNMYILLCEISIKISVTTVEDNYRNEIQTLNYLSLSLESICIELVNYKLSDYSFF